MFLKSQLYWLLYKNINRSLVSLKKIQSIFLFVVGPVIGSTLYQFAGKIAPFAVVAGFVIISIGRFRYIYNVLYTFNEIL